MPDSVLVPGATAANKVYDMHSTRELVHWWEMKGIKCRNILYIPIYIYVFIYI